MAIVSYLQLDHPALGTAGGVALHASIEAIYKKIGDNIADRLLIAVNLNDTDTATLEHNFNCSFADLRYDLYLYDEVTTALTRVTDSSSPSLADFAIVANGGDATGKIDVTNNSGAQRDLALVVFRDPIYLREGDVKDVDISTVAPEDGQALVFDAADSKFKPGASGDSSFKIQSVTDPNAVIKGGYLGLDDGRELATYDGSGSASTDYGGDLTVSLDTILGGNPADATTYYLYVDLQAVSAGVAVTGTGRKLVGVTESELVLLTTAPDVIDRTRYVHLGFVRSADTGTVWSGTGSAFGTLASRKHDNLSLSGPRYDQIHNSNPTFPIAHGLGDGIEVPVLEVLQETASGEWEPVSPTGHVRASATEILGSLASLFTGGALRVRLIARLANSPIGIQTATAETAGLVKSYAPSPRDSINALTDAGYTVLDNDGYDTLLLSTGASDRTVTLPTAADNDGRLLRFKKTDSGAGKVIIDGEGSEQIDGATTFELTTQYANVALLCDGSAWHIFG